jgi:hypothetical protein
MQRPLERHPRGLAGRESFAGDDDPITELDLPRRDVEDLDELRARVAGARSTAGEEPRDGDREQDRTQGP